MHALRLSPLGFNVATLRVVANGGQSSGFGGRGGAEPERLSNDTIQEAWAYAVPCCAYSDFLSSQTLDTFRC